MSTLSTHVLDTSIGLPAAGVSVVLEQQSAAGVWSEIDRGATDSDGRLKHLAAGKVLTAGIYRLTFDTAAYFAARRVAGFYPQVTVVFELQNAREHYHVPLLLSPFGYSTYRGS
ncbi:MAG TPA: hydroxyisourate hydrolase [Candidatus Eisenbacteria bacterium]|nr:hydroxyisourate hydrolase [Candidatus Eisenbacteria bacterium]